MIIFFILFPLFAFSQTEAEIGAYSNFIWRGTTFSENKPSLQLDMTHDMPAGFYVGSFFSSAEFSDQAMGENATVTSEIDATFGRKWQNKNWKMQTYYSKYFFPNAWVFDTDEWNLQISYKKFLFELSYLDDYFGYHSRYTYLRIGNEWIYKKGLEGALFIGYSDFDRPKGNVRTKGNFETLDGAGNPNYIDIYFTNRKYLENETYVELSLNWTNRKEYSVDAGEVSLAKAKDFAVITAYVIPFDL